MATLPKANAVRTKRPSRKLPKSWLEAAGLLKGKSRIQPLRYQRRVRRDWEARLKELTVSR